MGHPPPKPRQAHRNHYDFPNSSSGGGGGGGGGVIKKNFSSHSSSNSTNVAKKPTTAGTKRHVSKAGRAGGSQLVMKKPAVAVAVVPFGPSDRILLVGEGDFSFALSLVEHHKCTHVTATCYDSEEVLHQKYPQARGILERFLRWGQGRELRADGEDEDGDEAGQGGLEARQKGEGEGMCVEQSASMTRNSSSSEWEGLSPSPTGSPTTRGAQPPASPPPHPKNGSNTNAPQTPALTSTPTPTPLSSPSHSTISFHSSISAQTLARHKPIRQRSPYNRIIFNFPHVGGRSTDVNRQVRANQELLVAFLEACKPLLASRSNPVKVPRRQGWGGEEPGLRGGGEYDRVSYGDDDEDGDVDDEAEEAARSTSGQVIISLFDGEPYSLWNIRDLARHSGFRVVTSWRFPWEAYPGYRHARTLGRVRRRNGADADGDGDVSGVEEGEGDEDRNGGGELRRKARWRGEEREARGFVFEMVGVDAADERGKGKGDRMEVWRHQDRDRDRGTEIHGSKSSNKKRRRTRGIDSSGSDN